MIEFDSYYGKCESCKWRGAGSCSVRDVRFIGENTKSDKLKVVRTKTKTLAESCSLYQQMDGKIVSNKEFIAYHFFRDDGEKAKAVFDGMDNHAWAICFKEYVDHPSMQAVGKPSLMGYTMWELLGAGVNYMDEKHPTYSWLEKWLDEPSNHAFNGNVKSQLTLLKEKKK